MKITVVCHNDRQSWQEISGLHTDKTLNYTFKRKKRIKRADFDTSECQRKDELLNVK